MRFPIVVALVEAGLLGSVIAISHLRAQHGVARDVAPPPAFVRHDQKMTLRQENDDFLRAFQAARGGLDLRLRTEDKAAGLAPQLVDAILRLEGMHDPTRVRLFGPALRMQVRPGTASMTDVFGDRWTRVSADPNLHRRVRYIAQGWLRPVAGGCGAFWMFRRNNTAIMLDGLTPGECRRLRSGESSPASPTPVVAARLTLPAFAAPYPGNRLSPEDLRAEMDARVQQVRDERWLHGRARSPIFGMARR